MINNYKLYEEAKLLRIFFILKLIGNHWNNIHKTTTNPLITHTVFLNPLYFEHARHTGYIPLESFVYLDSEGLIQNDKNMPIIYHYNRKTFDKKIIYNSNINVNDTNLRFMYKMSSIDVKDESRKNTKKYWWL